MTFYSSPRWSAEIADCSMPMTFDQYSNCSYGCIYCFSQFQRANSQGSGGGTGSAYLAKTVNAVSVDKVTAMFTLQKESQFSPFIRERKVLQWGGLSDPFCNFERKHRVGLELLRMFKGIDYPICFSTKGTWWLKDPAYTDLFRGQKNWNVKVSIVTLDERKSRTVEPGVPAPLERLDAIKRIADLDCGGATLRLRPFIIGVTDPTHKEMIRLAGEAGAGAMTTEFFCLEMRSKLMRARMLKMNEAAGFDLLALYRRIGGAGYLRLNRRVKRKFVDEMEAAARSAGMRFYVSDAHFKERCDSGSCCGLPESWNYSRGQFTEALLIAKRTGQVRLSDILPGMQWQKSFLWRNAQGFNTNSTESKAEHYYKTMHDYVRMLWNSPQKKTSPAQYFGGVLAPEPERDPSGDIVYRYVGDPTNAKEPTANS